MAWGRPHIYYAHPMSWYNTEDETFDLAELAKFGTAVNPNSQYFRNAGPHKTMQFFLDYIEDHIDVVAFRPYRDGKLGPDVAAEIVQALVHGKELWQIQGKGDGIFINKKPLLWPSQYDLASFGFGDILTRKASHARTEKGIL